MNHFTVPFTRKTYSDITRAINSSRRALERRFRKALGRSIHQEVRRIRIEEIIRLLLETELSISEIAEKLNFYSVDHISRFFRQEKGISPMTFRKQFNRSYRQ